MTQEEINKKAYERYPILKDFSDEINRFQNSRRQGYIEAYKEISFIPTIKGWVARDRSGLIHVFLYDKPERDTYDDVWRGGENFALANTLFPDLRWEDEPIEVELPIIQK